MTAASNGRVAGGRAGHHPVSLAPMMQCTDRHFRFLLRLVSRHALLYTEMVTTPAILRGDRARHLDYDASEHPVALQLGGDDPKALAACARIAADWGYDEVNLNVGCPSDRVQSGSFGACLMARPHRVAECVAAMRAVVPIPVTVKHRIGIDDSDSYEFLCEFVDAVSAAGCDRFTVHARKAWLSGVSPKANRTVPPLRHGDVHRLKAERPHLRIELNGGLRTLDEMAAHLPRVDAVMVGRAVYDNPYLFAGVDERFYGAPGGARTREEIVAAMVPYAEARMRHGHSLHAIARHMLGLFGGEPAARVWKQALAEVSRDRAARPEALLDAMGAYQRAVVAHYSGSRQQRKPRFEKDTAGTSNDQQMSPG